LNPPAIFIADVVCRSCPCPSLLRREAAHQECRRKAMEFAVSNFKTFESAQERPRGCYGKLHVS
jgi:hypothetical protein